MSYNSITTIEGLSHHTRLNTLLLDHNLISSLQSIVTNLPLTSDTGTGTGTGVLTPTTPLTTLSLSSNTLSTLTDLIFLSKLESALTTLHLAFNPLYGFASSLQIDLRPFLIFLLPRLMEMDGQSIQEREWRISQRLFTAASLDLSGAAASSGGGGGGDGNYDPALIELLRPEHSDRLAQYLSVASPLASISPTAAASNHPRVEAAVTKRDEQKHQPMQQTAPLITPKTTHHQSLNTTAPVVGGGGGGTAGSDLDRLKQATERHKQQMRRDLEASRKKRESRSNGGGAAGLTTSSPPPQPLSVQHAPVPYGTPARQQPTQSKQPEEVDYELPQPNRPQSAASAPVIAPTPATVPAPAATAASGGPPVTAVVSVTDLLQTDEGYQKLKTTVRDMKRFLREFAQREKDREQAKTKTVQP